MNKFFCEFCNYDESSDDKHKKSKKSKCKCRGKRGYPGPSGIQGATGATGASGDILSAADFYALMPGDNPATVAVGSYVIFPQNGESVGTDITRGPAPESNFVFNLGPIGLYQIFFQVSVTEAGQLQLNLNNTVIANSVVGRATGTSQITGMSLIRTSSINSILKVQNPSGNSTALTITPLAGGASPVSAHLVITLLSKDNNPV
jgi:hypothetical protein